MTSVVFYPPHADDETLSAGLALIHYLAAGLDVHVVLMNRGGNGGPLGQLNGDQACTWHGGIKHNPATEGYAPLTTLDVALGRVQECRSAVGAMGTITPNSGVAATGKVFFHEADLPDGFGGVSGQPPTAQGIALARAAMEPFIIGPDAIPNAFHYTMSWTDNHPDHAACGMALKAIKQDNPTAFGIPRYFVSRLYWNDADVIAAGTTTFPVNATRKADYIALLKGRVAGSYSAWLPADGPVEDPNGPLRRGAYGFGYHQVVNQFLNNLAAPENRWHA